MKCLLDFKCLLDSIRSVYPDFLPRDTTNYTLRYIFYRVSDEHKNACFSVVTGLWSMHEKMFNDIVSDVNIESALCEYVCEYDSSFCGVVSLVKEKEVV